MTQHKVRCLILACGNTLRRDDGVGPSLADWAQQHFAEDPRIRIISHQQWTPDLAADIAGADSVLFLDCSVESAPGEIQLCAVEPVPSQPGLASHHIGAAELLALTQELFGTVPRTSLLLTVGAGSTELGEVFSCEVRAALADATKQIDAIIARFLEN